MKYRALARSGDLVAVAALCFVALYAWSVAQQLEVFQRKVEDMQYGAQVFVVTRPDGRKLAVSVHPGESLRDVVAVARAFLDTGVVPAESPAVKHDAWTDDQGQGIEVVTTQGPNETMQAFCDRHDAAVTAAQQVVDCVPEDPSTQTQEGD